MSKRNFKIKRYFQYEYPFYSIECNGYSVLELKDDNLKLAKKIKEVLERECQDVVFWFEEDLR